MMHVTCAVLTAEEVAVVSKAARLIDIAFPPNTDPLVPPHRAVDPHHRLRKALLGMRSSYDVVSWQRLVAARESLEALWEQVVVESSEAHWLELAATVDPDSYRYASVLAAERRGQQRLVADAMAVVQEALAPMSEADDTELLREQTGV